MTLPWFSFSNVKILLVLLAHLHHESSSTFRTGLSLGLQSLMKSAFALAPRFRWSPRYSRLGPVVTINSTPTSGCVIRTSRRIYVSETTYPFRARPHSKIRRPSHHRSPSSALTKADPNRCCSCVALFSTCLPVDFRKSAVNSFAVCLACAASYGNDFPVPCCINAMGQRMQMLQRSCRKT